MKIQKKGKTHLEFYLFGGEKMTQNEIYCPVCSKEITNEIKEYDERSMTEHSYSCKDEHHEYSYEFVYGTIYENFNEYEFATSIYGAVGLSHAAINKETAKLIAKRDYLGNLSQGTEQLERNYQAIQYSTNDSLISGLIQYALNYHGNVERGRYIFEDMISLVDIDRIDNIEFLEFENCSFKSLEKLSYIPNLKTILFDNCKEITFEKVRLKNVYSIYFIDCYLDDLNFVTMRKFPILKYFFYNYTAYDNGKKIFDLFPLYKMKHITNIELINSTEVKSEEFTYFTNTTGIEIITELSEGAIF